MEEHLPIISLDALEEVRVREVNGTRLLLLVTSSSRNMEFPFPSPVVASNECGVCFVFFFVAIFTRAIYALDRSLNYGGRSNQPLGRLISKLYWTLYLVGGSKSYLYWTDTHVVRYFGERSNLESIDP